jgi:hypothetical protein
MTGPELLFAVVLVVTLISLPYVLEILWYRWRK